MGKNCLLLQHCFWGVMRHASETLCPLTIWSVFIMPLVTTLGSFSHSTYPSAGGHTNPPVVRVLAAHTNGSHTRQPMPTEDCLDEHVVDDGQDDSEDQDDEDDENEEEEYGDGLDAEDSAGPNNRGEHEEKDLDPDPDPDGDTDIAQKMIMDILRTLPTQHAQAEVLADVMQRWARANAVWISSYDSNCLG